MVESKGERPQQNDSETTYGDDDGDEDEDVDAHAQSCEDEWMCGLVNCGPCLLLNRPRPSVSRRRRRRNRVHGAGSEAARRGGWAGGGCSAAWRSACPVRPSVPLNQWMGGHFSTAAKRRNGSDCACARACSFPRRVWAWKQTHAWTWTRTWTPPAARRGSKAKQSGQRPAAAFNSDPSQHQNHYNRCSCRMPGQCG